MSKKNDILNKQPEIEEYELNDEERNEIASLIALVEQARVAQDFIYSRLLQNIADRLEIVDRDIELNMPEIIAKGVKEAKLIVR